MLFYTVLKGIFLHVFIANDEFIQKKIDLPPYYFLCRGRIKSNSSPNNISCIAFCQCKPKKNPEDIVTGGNSGTHHTGLEVVFSR